MPDPDPVIDRAVSALRSGRLVVMPTETVYGLAADAGNADAVAAIYALKERPAGHPLIVHVSGVEAARWWAELGPAGERLAHAFWPGPMTLIVQRRAEAPAHACGGHRTIGLRVPSHPVAQRLLQRFEAAGGHGVAAPSANRFGRISPTRAGHVVDDLGDRTPLLLDGGPAEFGLESTIVDVSGESIAILRPGAIGAAQIEAALGRRIACAGQGAERPTAVSDAAGTNAGSTSDGAPDTDSATDSDKAGTPGLHPASGRPAAPGTLAAHYAPLTPLELVDAASLVDRVRALLDRGLRVGVYSVHEPHVALADDATKTCGIVWLPMPVTSTLLAQRLYADLRQLDAGGSDRLVVEQVPDETGYAAIRDRLQRAVVGSRSATRMSPTARRDLR